MGRAQIKKKSTFIDMTAMSDGTAITKQQMITIPAFFIPTT